MLRLAYIGGLGMMAGPAATHLSKSEFAQVVRVHDRGTPGETRDQYREAWQKHGAQSVATIEALIGVGDLDGVVICAGKNGDDLPIISEVSLQLSRMCTARPFILHLSTVSANFAELATQHCETLGIDYSNYPLTGGPLGAQLGGADPKGMLILASGKKELYEKLLPILNLLGHPKYFGTSPAAGAITKLIGHHMVFNGLTGITSAAAIHAECFDQGKLGSEAQGEYLGFLNGGAGGTRQWDVALHKGIVGAAWSEGFGIQHAVVDAIYAARLAKENGLPRYSIMAMLNVAYAFSYLLNKYPGEVMGTHAIVREMVAEKSSKLDDYMEKHGAFERDLEIVFDKLEQSLPDSVQHSARIKLALSDFV